MKLRTFRSPLPPIGDKDTDPMRCQCGWEGTRRETQSRAFNRSTAHRASEGTEYSCPHCGLIISITHTKVS